MTSHLDLCHSECDLRTSINWEIDGDANGKAAEDLYTLYSSRIQVTGFQMLIKPW